MVEQNDFSNFMKVSAELLQSWTHEDFIDLAVESIGNVLHGVDAVLVYEYRSRNQTLIVKHAWGFECDIKGLFPMQISEGVGGAVFSGGEGMLVNDMREIERLFKDTEYFLDLIHVDENTDNLFPTSMIAVPIKIENKIHGVLQVISLTDRLGFGEGDYNYCCYISELISLNLEWQSVIVQKENAERDALYIKDSINMDDDHLAYYRMVSNSMNELFLRGKGFADIMAMVEAHMPFKISLYDLFLERLSCTSNAVKQELPDNLLELKPMQDMIRWKSARSIESAEMILHLLPVLCGEHMRGFIAVWMPIQPFTKKQQIFLEITCRNIAFVWVKLAAVHEANQYMKSEILSSILSGKQDSDFLHKTSALGMAADNMFFVILVAKPDVKNHITYCNKQDGDQLLNYLHILMEKKGLGCVLIPEGKDICIIASYKDLNRKNSRYNNIVNDIMSEIFEKYPDLVICAGRIYAGIYNIRKSYWEANQCMSISNKYFFQRKTLNYGDMGVLRLVLTQKEEDVESYIQDILGPVVEYDKKRDGELMTTLFYYSRMNKSIGNVAAKLNIHVNTLYQRIRKTEELMGYNFDDTMDWLDVQTASIMYGLLHTDLIDKV